MLLTKFKRIARSGWVNFWRNGSVSLASVLVMTVTLIIIASLLLSGALLSSTLNTIRQKVDITVYFVTNAPDDQILNIQKNLQALPEVAAVDYISSDDALAAFKARHINDAHTMTALSELDTNPLGSELTIKAKDPTQYAGIAQYLSSNNSLVNAPDGTPIIDKINYAQNKDAIDAINRIMASSRKLGLAVAIFFSLISILITFNTIRLAIYISREEIAVMRLVGASGQYIRGPFVIEGLLYGAASAAITLMLLYPVTLWLGPIGENLGTGINLFGYYLNHFVWIFFVVVGSGLAIGALSSYLAVKRYLKI